MISGYMCSQAVVRLKVFRLKAEGENWGPDKLEPTGCRIGVRHDGIKRVHIYNCDTVSSAGMTKRGVPRPFTGA